MEVLSVSLWFLVFSAPVTLPMVTRANRNCLLQQKLYHAGTGQCHHPLELEGPCEADHWLMPRGETGLAECVPANPDLPEYCTPVLAGLKEVVCLEKLEEILYKTSNCTNGQILLPENFKADSRPCPGSWTCRDNQTILQKIFPEISVPEESLEWRYLAGLVCSQDNQLCLPDSDQEALSLLSTEVLVSSLQSPRARCQPNPCPTSYWPWLGQDGYYGCFPAGEGVQHCQQQSYLHLTEEGTLECGIIDVRFISGNSGCRKCEIWIEGRKIRGKWREAQCIPIYC